jgi:hypothetical protein
VPRPHGVARRRREGKAASMSAGVVACPACEVKNRVAATATGVLIARNAAPLCL